MTKYIKTAITEFEQFDGSDEMIGKYDIDPEQIGEGMPMYQLETLEGTMQIFIGDWIATGVDGEHWPVKDEIFKKTYKKLPVIPEYAADYIVYWKEQNNSLIDIALESAHTRMDSDDSSEAFDWVHNHFEKFSRAWLDGYEVAEVEE